MRLHINCGHARFLKDELFFFFTVIALQKVKESLRNPPLDWNGDPCMPRQYSWTGITCSEGPRIRVVTL